MIKQRLSTDVKYSETEARAAIPDNVKDISIRMVDRFHLETARQEWPDPNPPAYPRMAAAVDIAGYIECWQGYWTVEQPDMDQDEYFDSLGI